MYKNLWPVVTNLHILLRESHLYSIKLFIELWHVDVEREIREVTKLNARSAFLDTHEFLIEQPHCYSRDHNVQEEYLRWDANSNIKLIEYSI